MKTKINELVELQQKYKVIYEQYDTICGIDNNGVHVFGLDALRALAKQVGAEIETRENENSAYKYVSYFYYKDIKFFAVCQSEDIWKLTK